nr:MAG TPA: hypothetical protein [Caudoviricetes sp.]DAU16632.1 MAG TPA: hypothetical protein [Caudoviricetes sp.]
MSYDLAFPVSLFIKQTPLINVHGIFYIQSIT